MMGFSNNNKGIRFIFFMPHNMKSEEIAVLKIKIGSLYTKDTRRMPGEERMNDVLCYADST